MVVAAGTSPVLLLLLACPIGMGLMMWFMYKGMSQKHHNEGMTGGKMRDRAMDERSLAELKAEQARLAAKIEAMEDERRPERERTQAN